MNNRRLDPNSVIDTIPLTASAVAATFQELVIRLFDRDEVVLLTRAGQPTVVALSLAKFLQITDRFVQLTGRQLPEDQVMMIRHPSRGAAVLLSEEGYQQLRSMEGTSK